MRHLRKGIRAERAHQYRVIASRLHFHLDGQHYSDEELIQSVKTAEKALLRAADFLEREERRASGRQAS